MPGTQLPERGGGWATTEFAQRTAAAVAALTGAYALAFGRDDTPEIRRWLSEELKRATDPRVARWWQLVTIIQPPPVQSDATSLDQEHHRHAQTIAWLHEALDLQP